MWIWWRRTKKGGRPMPDSAPPQTTVQAPRQQFTALDRCDRCGAQAYVRAYLTNGELLFCSHHGREHIAKLIDGGAIVHDETGQLA